MAAPQEPSEEGAAFPVWYIGRVNHAGEFRKASDLGVGSGPFYSLDDAQVSLKGYQDLRHVKRASEFCIFRVVLYAMPER